MANFYTKDLRLYTALYERLSKDDELQGESNSISNQKEYLEGYANRNEFQNIKHYTDDGYTGKNFNRPGIQKLIADVEGGLIGTIIVKDMSRFGRNYLQVGFYTEILFPKKGVRFIAVNNNVDSNRPQDNDFTPFLNIMNEWYVKDTSNKIKAIFLSKMKEGKRCSGSIPYGYNRLPDDKQTLVVDPIASKVVQRIFELAAERKGPTEIARILEADKVLVPSSYTFKYHPEQCNFKTSGESCHWVATTVSQMLRTREYVGDTVLRKSICTNFKTDTRRPATEDEKFIFENTHEPIISRELWERVQKYSLRQKKYAAPGTYSHGGVLNGLVFCADCGRKMTRTLQHNRTAKDAFYYFCSAYRGERSTCTSHYIQEEILFTLILHSIRRLAKRVISDEEGFAKELQEKWKSKESAKPNKTKAELISAQKRCDELDGMIQVLYENFANQLLPERQYKILMQKYADEQNNLSAKINELRDNLTQNEIKVPNINKFIKIIQDYKNPTELTREMACTLIDKICIHQTSGKGKGKTCQIDIYFNFIGQVDLTPTEEELQEMAELEAKKLADRKAKKKARSRKNTEKWNAKRRAEHYAANDGHKFAKKTCENCGKEFWPTGNRQRYCSIECKNEVYKSQIYSKRFAEKGDHIFKQKNCIICGKPFWPSNGQELMCSPECKVRRRNERQLAYYHLMKNESKELIRA